MNWHYVENGQSVGPVTDEQLTELARNGKINATTLVWREGLAQWAPYSKINPEAFPPSANAGETVACSECGKFFPISEMIRHGAVYVCANCKPVFMQKLSEGAYISASAGDQHYAGFWIRFAAKLLDGLILGVPFGILFLILLLPQIRANPSAQTPFLPLAIQLLVQLGLIVVNLGYQVFFLGKYGATPGKMICKLKVVKASGEPLSYGRATGRYFAEMLSGMVCYIGYIMVGFDAQKRGLHDHICNTRVVYK